MNIIGAGGHAKVISDILTECKIQIEGVWDENPSAQLYQHPMMGDFDDFNSLDTEYTIIAIGNNAIRKKLALQLKTPTVVNAIHPTSFISERAAVGAGTVVMANASVNAGAIVGKHAIINTNASVDHDCIIGDFVHISPQVGLAGGVSVGEGTHIGIGACVIQGVKIGSWAIIGAGSVIINDIPDNAVVVGNPGKVIKFNNL